MLFNGQIANDKLKHKKRKFRDIPWTKRRKLLRMSRAQILRIRASQYRFFVSRRLCVLNETRRKEGLARNSRLAC